MGVQSQFYERCHVSDTAYHRFLKEAPYLARCSDNKTAALIRPREYAIRYPYMQVNAKDRVSWLVFDLDHSDSMIWDDPGIPSPNFVVRNRNNGHSHLYYAIVPVCTSSNARSAPIHYMKAVYRSLAKLLRADLAYSGPVAKTPGHCWWDTLEIHTGEYELGELADHLDLLEYTTWRKEPDLESVAHSRHQLLFEELRHYAYAIVNNEREDGTYQSFHRSLENYASAKNNFRNSGFTSNLTFSQVKATVKSVARWTWDKYTGNAKCHRGVMGLDDSLLIQERQRLAAQRTHKHRKSSTESKIRSVCKSLITQGEALTQKAIATATGLTRQTIAKYKHIFAEVQPLRISGHSLEKSTNKKNNNSAISDVKYGVHQISAKLPECMYIKQETYYMDFHRPSDKGASGAKNVFSEICSMLVDIPRVEGIDCPFSFRLRGRMARLILSYKLGYVESVGIAISVAAAAVDTNKSYFTDDQWLRYLCQALINAKNSRKK